MSLEAIWDDIQCAVDNLRRTFLADSDLDITGQQLTSIARAHKHSSAGLDGWRGTDVAALPEPFWHLVVTLWNAIRTQNLRIPEIWRHIRMALIPKDDDSFRPNSITPIMWRICSSATTQRLKRWIATIAHRSLSGGIPQ